MRKTKAKSIKTKRMAKKTRRVSKKRGKPGVKVSSRRKEEEMERGQVWSVDVLLAVVIFISVILIFYTAMVARQKPSIDDLEAEAVELKIELEQNTELGFIQADEVDEEKLDAFVNSATDDYNELKRKLGMRGEFCIFYEDADGNIILFSGNKTSIGNSAVYINGTPCGSEVTIT